MKEKLIFIFAFLLSVSLFCFQENNKSNLEDFFLKNNIIFKKLDIKNGLFNQRYTLLIRQPLNHKDLSKGYFEQRVILSHVDINKPVVLITEGYSMQKNYLSELSEILRCNELRVEHRFFGRSLPKEGNKGNWQYLNTYQATADYHKIVTLFKEIYKKKWVSIGWSKGGQTSLLYRYNYPNDVSLTIAYDAPLNFSTQDNRIDDFFEHIGDKNIRSSLISFQRRVLKNKSKVLPIFKDYSEKNKISYPMGYEKALEYIVLEYPFSFWQYTKFSIDDIPDKNSSLEILFNHLKSVVSFYSYSDRAMNSPAQYMFQQELGYYGYVQKNVKEYLSSNNYDNAYFAPKGIKLKFNPKIMKNLDLWLKSKASDIICIYGSNDPWSAPKVSSPKNKGVMIRVLNKGNHFTFIKNFSAKEQKELIDKIKTTLL